jgi:transcriptional regulator with XRE-family HTH domain
MSERSDLIDKLISSKGTREAYIRSKVSTNLASQIRALRRRGELTQEGLAEVSGMKQSRISEMERPGSRLTIETLVRLAAALKIGLTVRFGSFSEMLKWENGFSQDEFDVVDIDDDLAFTLPEELTEREKGTTGDVIASWANSLQAGLFVVNHAEPAVINNLSSTFEKNRPGSVIVFVNDEIRRQNAFPLAANAVRENEMANVH